MTEKDSNKHNKEKYGNQNCQKPVGNMLQAL
jgi:hypothetical protein